MKDTEFAKVIEEILERNSKDMERLNGLLELELVDCSREERFAEFAFEPKEWCKNPYGEIHGGAICALFDTTMGMGAVAMVQNMLATTDLSVSYLRPMKAVRHIFRAEYTQVGKRMIRCTGEGRNAETGELCATCMASFIITENKVRVLRI